MRMILPKTRQRSAEEIAEGEEVAARIKAALSDGEFTEYKPRPPRRSLHSAHKRVKTRKGPPPL
jgi:hypothetical protein